ncbi:MAG: secretion protein EccK [Mycobacterium sp.]
MAGASPMPLGPPTTPAPAAPATSGATPAGAPYGPAVAQAPAQASSAVGAGAAVPVSAARAERDAAVAASTAGALRRRNQGNDPAQMARRIAAALNVGNFDFGFYWVTALTAEGTMLVANSYGIGYIPANVALPEGVRMVSADESIPAQMRAAWATYPILALQGWAQHHNERLRGVIATEDQFNGFDPGAAKIVLQPEDIPEDGTMRGRTRLEVIAPQAAAKLAATRDDGLAALLPPAPTAIERPEGDWAMLWFEVSKPLMSSSTSRAEAHLEAFRVYADQAMALALCTAQTEPETPAQRAAIADWVYWQHQSSLITEALGSAAS